MYRECPVCRRAMLRTAVACASCGAGSEPWVVDPLTGRWIPESRAKARGSREGSFNGPDAP